MPRALGSSQWIHSLDCPPCLCPQRGLVASAWQLYHAAGEPVLWKSGGTAGYGSFMVFNPATKRGAVALGSCGNCGEKAVQQLARQLVDVPRRVLPALPARPTAAALAAYTGCYELGGGGTTVLRVALPPLRHAAHAGVLPPPSLLLIVADFGADPRSGGGSAGLIPVAWPAPAPAPLPPLPARNSLAKEVDGGGRCALAIGFALRGNDTLWVRPSSIQRPEEVSRAAAGALRRHRLDRDIELFCRTEGHVQQVNRAPPPMREGGPGAHTAAGCRPCARSQRSVLPGRRRRQ